MSSFAGMYGHVFPMAEAAAEGARKEHHDDYDQEIG
jgi:hypothetical protein